MPSRLRLLLRSKRRQRLPPRDPRMLRSQRYRPGPFSQVKIAVAPPPPPQPKAIEAADPVKERLLALVVEKTGYPIDMLDLDLDMEADLGVDTVKQAELFAAIREIYNIERDANLKLRDFPTLKHVIGFVYSKRPDLAVAKPKRRSNAAQPSVPPRRCCRPRLLLSKRSRTIR